MAFVGAQVEPGGHERDNGQAEGGERRQPRRHAGHHRHHQAGGAEHLRDPNEDHQRTRHSENPVHRSRPRPMSFGAPAGEEKQC